MARIGGVVLLIGLSCGTFAHPLSAQAVSSDYRLGPKDVVEIRVAEIPELGVDRRVQDNGSIDLPLLGQVPIAGLTAMEIRDRLTALLTAKYVNQAYVTVTIKEFANRPIVILGAVAKPGNLNVSGRWTLQQALLQSGGLATGAGKRITILRASDNGLSDRLEVSTDELFVRFTHAWNVPLFPGDIVTVGAKQQITVYLLGEFKTSGPVQLESDQVPTLLFLVAKVGGFTDKAATGSVRVKRRGPDGLIKNVVVNYKRILSGKDPDFPLQEGDVLVAKESLL